MLDTVNFTLTRAEVEGVNFLDEVTPLLDPGSVVESRRADGSTWTAGKTGNLRVSVNGYQVKVTAGSLCKWEMGDNYQTMKRGDIRDAVEKLSDTLRLPMDRAIITRLDVGTSIPVKYPPACYLKHLGALKYAVRLEQPHSLYYSRCRRAETLCFYDKNKEQRKHHETIPGRYRDCNVLRYEQRYTARLPRLLNVEAVTGAMLYDESFYKSLLNRWREAYQAIRKTDETTINFDAVQTPKEFYRMGLLSWINQTGGETKVLGQIDDARKRGDLTKMQASRLRQTVKKACDEQGVITNLSEDVAELNNKIEEAVKFNLEQSVA